MEQQHKLKGYVVPRRGFPASTYVADLDINTRLRNKYHMNLSESVGFFGESSSKIINTSMLGGLAKDEKHYSYGQDIYIPPSYPKHFINTNIFSPFYLAEINKKDDNEML